MNQRWPDHLWIIRHGESAGNLARDAAHAARLPRIDTLARDVDVPLSERGESQARALGRWFSGQDLRPDVVFVSPYLRAQQTAALMQAEGGMEADPRDFLQDERLREKEFGILDRLTRWGIEAEHPQQAELRRILGKFYHRPPGGESWCDVILRLRGALDTISLHHAGQRVMIVAHQVVVLCLRYLIEGMTEDQILAVDAEGDVANCSITAYAFDPAAGPRGGLVLRAYNHTIPIEAEGAPVTAEPDAPVAAR
ncbi:histidine phosphatase family protein [Belnapia sp. T6]|uniref:phosphoglycerate mutase (2,3-diphosphoglycerate-dependent) n=1 Tax=Belnapia mucosa TaxID=2804532 RepID=A0ABS1UWS8_9PROT|nr:histidine phosphatase family protein [Belnapia mucosa]MBL6453924.1 histidine phosphatase family protein [Belnapia mucosa]